MNLEQRSNKNKILIFKILYFICNLCLETAILYFQIIYTSAKLWLYTPCPQKNGSNGLENYRGNDT